jgi:hypothetical protein
MTSPIRNLEELMQEVYDNSHQDFKSIFLTIRALACAGDLERAGFGAINIVFKDKPELSSRLKVIGYDLLEAAGKNEYVAEKAYKSGHFDIAARNYEAVGNILLAARAAGLGGLDLEAKRLYDLAIAEREAAHDQFGAYSIAVEGNNALKIQEYARKVESLYNELTREGQSFDELLKSRDDAKRYGLDLVYEKIESLILARTIEEGEFDLAAKICVNKGKLEEALDYYLQGGNLLWAADTCLKLKRFEDAKDYFEQAGCFKLAAEATRDGKEAARLYDLAKDHRMAAFCAEREGLVEIAVRNYQALGNHQKAAKIAFDSLPNFRKAFERN